MSKNMLRTIAIAFFITLSFGEIKAGNDCTIMRTIPYLQMPTQNSMVVRWVTAFDCQGVVEYGTDSTKVANGTATKVNGTTNTLTHRIKLNNLNTGTKYYYRVCSKLPPCNSQSAGTQHYSDVYSFRTLKENSADFKMLILNDLHPNYSNHFNNVLYEFMPKASAIIDTMKYDLVVFNGDCFDGFDTEENIIYWLDRFSKFTKSNYIPFVLVAGNHEYDGKQADIANEYASMTLKKYVEFVHDGISYGKIDFSDLELLFLDTGQIESFKDSTRYFENYRRQQESYIDSLITSNDTVKKILIHHIPFFGHCTWDSDTIKNPYFKIGGAKLNQVNVILAINGHTHEFDYVKKDFINNSSSNYKNTYPVYKCNGPYSLHSPNPYACYYNGYGHSMTLLTKKEEKISLLFYLIKDNIIDTYVINNEGEKVKL
jgi:hypothetical protein